MKYRIEFDEIRRYRFDHQISFKHLKAHRQLNILVGCGRCNGAAFNMLYEHKIDLIGFFDMRLEDWQTLTDDFSAHVALRLQLLRSECNFGLNGLMPADSFKISTIVGGLRSRCRTHDQSFEDVCGFLDRFTVLNDIFAPSKRVYPKPRGRADFT